MQGNAKELAGYGMSPMHVGMLDKMMVDYTGEVVKPPNARTLRTTYTKGIKQLMQETDILLKAQMDKMIVSFKDNHPELVAQYKVARTIYDPPTLHTQVKGKVVTGEVGKAAKNATVTFTGPMELVLQTNAVGNFAIKPLPPPTYQVRVKAEGFADNVVEALVVKLGKITRLAVNVDAA